MPVGHRLMHLLFGLNQPREHTTTLAEWAAWWPCLQDVYLRVAIMNDFGVHEEDTERVHGNWKPNSFVLVCQNRGFICQKSSNSDASLCYDLFMLPPP